MKIAVIITGDVRDCNALDNIKDIFKQYDVFCGSYIRHENYISSIGKNNNSCLISEKCDIRLPDGITKENMQGNMLQWLHLDNIIKKFEDDLMSYDIILKYRFDYFIENTDFPNKMSVIPNTLFNNSDMIFYSDSLTFIKVFKTYYDNIKNYGYHPNRDISDDTLESSWKSEPALKMHLEKCGIINEKLPFGPGCIIRGSYNKVRGYGNKKLYIENELKGKFSK